MNGVQIAVLNHVVEIQVKQDDLIKLKIIVNVLQNLVGHMSIMLAIDSVCFTNLLYLMRDKMLIPVIAIQDILGTQHQLHASWNVMVFSMLKLMRPKLSVYVNQIPFGWQDKGIAG